MKFTLKKLTRRYFRSQLFSRTGFLYSYVVKSYGQEGEDIILGKLFADQKSGFYVDIGAFHPKRFSNTYLFYKRGWKGINIEPNPLALKKFAFDRKRDVNLNIAVSDKVETVDYLMFDEPALNAFKSKIDPVSLPGMPSKTVQVNARDLKSILAEWAPKNQEIDFMNVDVEGMQVDVLGSNDWNRFRPKVILVEDFDIDLEHPEDSDTFRFLKSQGYKLFSKPFFTSFYLREDFYEEYLRKVGKKS